jgi:hypothetical protein
MLGEKIYEMKGKVLGQRVLPSDPEGPRMEVTFGGSVEGHGRMASFKGSATATYVAVAGPDGNFYGNGQAIVMSNEGERFTIKGDAVGQITGGKVSYRGGVSFRSGSTTLKWLNRVYGVFEYDQDLNTQEVIFTCYEWK